MLSSTRQEKILELLNEKKQVKTQKLKEKFDVSAVTIRNDLEKLEKEGYLNRVHGGAVLPENKFSKANFTFQNRSQKNIKEKTAICKQAAKLIGDSDSILLDGSSTILHLIPYLKEYTRLTIVTNGVYTALKTKDYSNLNTILLGGMIREDSGAIEGLLGKEMLAKINSNLMFTSAHGFTLEQGLLNFDLYVVQLKQKMAEQADKVIALLDHTKIGNPSTASFAPPEKIDTIITDHKTPAKKIEKIKTHGINVIKTKK